MSLQEELIRVYVLKNPEEETGEPFAAPPPAIILKLQRGVLAFSPDEDPNEVAFFETVHALQVAHGIDGGRFDELFEESDEGLEYWRADDQTAELLELAELAINCTPGYEGQTISL